MTSFFRIAAPVLRWFGALAGLLVLIVAALPWWLPLRAVNEQLISVTQPELGKPLQISAVAWAWNGGPAVILSGVTVGGRATIDQVQLTPGLSVLWGELALRHLTLSGVYADVPRWQAWWAQRTPMATVDNQDSSPELSIATVTLEDVKLYPWAEQYGGIGGQVEFGTGLHPQAAGLSLPGLEFELQADGQGYQLRLQATRWQGPAGVSLGLAKVQGQWQPLVGNDLGQLNLAAEFSQTTIAGLAAPGQTFMVDQGSIEVEITQHHFLVKAITVDALGARLQGTGAGELEDLQRLDLALALELLELKLAALAEAFQLLPLTGDVSAFARLDIDYQHSEFGWQLAGDVQGSGLSVAGLALEQLTTAFALDSQGLKLSNLAASGYGGEVTGKADMLWSRPFSIDGQLGLKQIALEPLMADLKLSPVSGRLAAELELVWHAGLTQEAGQAPGNLSLNGDWRVEKGLLPGVDLKAAASLTASSISSQSGTAFDLAASKLRVANGKIRLDDIEIKSAVLAVTGDLVIDRDGSLAGEIQVGGNEALGVTRVPVVVAGTLEEPLLRPTKSSMLGGAVGSAVLGPGLGTAVGVKIGEGLNNLRKRFTTSDDESR